MTIASPFVAQRRTLCGRNLNLLGNVQPALVMLSSNGYFGAPFMTQRRRLCGKRRNLYDNRHMSKL